ncbi:MAG TPA: HAD-IA family hydrolase [Rhizomicrobium sp.]|nr:HAD-IA family hydrolase [Rhizomicrobium sp.]
MTICDGILPSETDLWVNWGMDSHTSPALVFDLDGTLVDTAPDLLGALNAILHREGRPPVNHADLRHLVGFGARTMLAEAFKMTGDPADEARLSSLMDDYIAHYKKHIAVASRPFPGVEATLGRLKAEGARMAVLTNKPQELTDLLLPALDLSGFFAAIHGAGRLEVNKPDARVFHAVIEELGGAGAGAVMIGDSVTDVKTARAAGVPVIVVDYGYTPEPAHMLGADAVTGDFSEIPALARRLLG